MKLFRNRTDAGQKLAAALIKYQDAENAIVLGLPRGGVPVAFEVATQLHLPLDIFLVRKLGVPGQEELAMGAVASGGVEVYNTEIIRDLNISRVAIEAVKQEQLKVLEQREKLYRGTRAFPDLENKIVILVDDGIATGASIRVAIKALKKMKCKKIVVATPVGPPEIYQEFKNEADEIICLATPTPFFAIGLWYETFNQTTDQEVCDLLQRA